ncbi:MAG: hypothetical protein ACE3JP_07330 [Ectobacillus sp.]
MANKDSKNDNKNQCGGCKKLKETLSQYGKGNVAIRITFKNGSQFPDSQLVGVSLEQCSLAIVDPYALPACAQTQAPIQVLKCNMIQSVKVFVPGQSFIVKF